MAVEPLAALADVQAALGRDLTPSESGRYQAILDKASELFRAESGQQFTPGRSQVRLKVNGGSVYLDQRPATEVHAVTDDAGREVSWTQFKQWLTVPRVSHQFVLVDYSHGSLMVPDLVRLTVAEVVKKVLTVSAEAAEGVTQYSETTGPFTESKTYATWAQGGQTMLAPDDKAIAQSFRVKTPRIWVAAP